MTSLSNVVLAQNSGNTQTEPSGLRIADDGVRGYSTTPTAHVRDMIADGITHHGIVVYFAIADRQASNKGEYFRSNEALAEETGMTPRAVQKWIAKLRAAQYLSVWYINGGRRMRVLTRVNSGAPQGEHRCTPPRTQVHPYKENNIKKTTTTDVCVSLSLSEEQRALLGESSVNKLVANFGERRVRRGLLAFDAADKSKITNPMGWLTRAVKDDYQPRKGTRVGQPFTEDTFEHDRIIREYMSKSASNTDKVNEAIGKGLPEGLIAFKIHKGTL